MAEGRRVRLRHAEGRRASSGPTSWPSVTGDDEDNLVVSLLAKQEFAVPACRGACQQPEERVDVQRDVGRRRVGQHPAPHHRSGAGGRSASVRSCACCRSRAARPSWPRSRLPRVRPRPTRRSPSSASPATPRSWPSCARRRWWCPRGDTILRVGDEVLVLVTSRERRRGRARCSSADSAVSWPNGGFVSVDERSVWQAAGCTRGSASRGGRARRGPHLPAPRRGCARRRRRNGAR